MELLEKQRKPLQLLHTFYKQKQKKKTKGSSSSSFVLEWDGPDHHYVVQCCKCCSDERSYPEYPLHSHKHKKNKSLSKHYSYDLVFKSTLYLYKRRWNTYVIIPCVVLVKNNGSSQAPCRVNSSSGDRNGGQVHQKHGEPNWQRRQYLKNQHKTHFQIVVFIRRLI